MDKDNELLFLRDSSGMYNATAIFHLVNSYSDEDRRMLLENAHVSSVEEFVELLIQQTSHYGNGSYSAANPAAGDLDQFIEYRVHKLLLLYVPPIFFIIGLVGNTLSAVILTRPPMRSISTYRYLTVLSFTDSLVLSVGLLRMWLGQLLIGNDVLDQWTWACKLVNVVGYTVSNFSVWLIVAVTVERFIAVCYPLMAPSVCSRRRSTRIIVAVLAVQLTVHVHFAWTVGVHATTASTTTNNATGALALPDDSRPTQCVASIGFQTLIEDVWPWVDAAIYSFIPFVVIMVLNAMIMHQVIVSKRDRGQLCQESSTNLTLRASHGAMEVTKKTESTRLTIMLLTVSFTFLITTFPMNTTVIATSYVTRTTSMSNGLVTDLELAAKLILLRTVCELLMYVNHSINFFLYCAAGQKFRRQLCALWRSPQHRVTRFDPVVESHALSEYRASRINNCDHLVDNVAVRL